MFGQSSRGLNLDGLTEFRRVTRRDHKISPLGFLLALYELPDRADRIHDRRPRRIGHEGGEGLDRAAAVGVLGERQHVFLLGFEPSDGGLDHLDQALIEQGYTGRRFATLRARLRCKREMRGLAGNAERLQVLPVVRIGAASGT